MLLELRIRNYAVIESLGIRLEPGLNVLTGETGAGKSILVDALSLLLGERASSEVVRPGAERATIEAVFDVARRDEVRRLLEEQGIEAEDGLLILRREVAAEGRNRAWINGSPATASLVGELGSRLVDLHGQHEHQTLLRPDEQRAILDAFAGAIETAAEVRELYRRASALEQESTEFDARRREVEQRSDFLRFQVDDIEKAELRPGEEEELAEQLNRLEHAEDLVRDSESLHDALYAGDESITTQLTTLRRVLGRLLRIDPSQDEAQELLESAYYNLEELGRRMGDYATAVEFDPARLERLRKRQDLLYRMKSKYGDTIEAVLELGRTAREELDALDRAELDRQELDTRLAAVRTELATAAARLGAARRDAAQRLAAAVGELLAGLGLRGGRFQVELTEREELAAHGAEDVEFLVALNRGFDPRPLRRVASGGELSRVMLALKTVLARVDSVPTLVFDEIDVGIGGRVAHQVAARLREVAAEHQVFAITHLAPIASRAEHHLRVEKEEREGLSITRVVPLSDDDRVRELVRMLGGDPADSESVEHAKKLLTTP